MTNDWKVVQIISRYRDPNPDAMESNYRAARQYCRYAVSEGKVPIASHVMLHGILDDTDPEQRNAAMVLSCDLVAEIASEVWVCGYDRGLSDGMIEELAAAIESDTRVRWVSTKELHDWLVEEARK